MLKQTHFINSCECNYSWTPRISPASCFLAVFLLVLAQFQPRHTDHALIASEL